MIKTYKQKPYHKRWVKLKVDGKDKYFYPLKDVLVLDIETKRKDTNKGVSAENSETVIWGAYSYNTGLVTYGKRGMSPQKLIDKHKTIITFNGKGFDIPVLKKDYDINMWDINHLDLLEILRPSPSKAEKDSMIKKGKKPNSGKGRAKIIGEAQQNGMIDNRFPNFKLATIMSHGKKLYKDNIKYAEFFKTFKGDIDYEILQKEEISDKEWEDIKKYLAQDLIITKNLFEFMEKYAESMIHNMAYEDILKLDYMSSPTGSYFYKCICHDLNLPVKYSDIQRKKFPGAKVLLPQRKKYTPRDGMGFCIDWASQHPHNIWSGNLATPISKCKHKIDGKCPNPYSGDGVVFNLTGKYCGCEMGEIEKWLRMMYFQRNIFRIKHVTPNGLIIKFEDCVVGDIVYMIDDKRNLIHKILEEKDIVGMKQAIIDGVDPREYSIKILINSGYGVLSSPIFESTYCETTGPDTTLMSHQSTGFVAKYMGDRGYIIAYGDTDSCYIMDPFNDKERMKKVLAEAVKIVRDALPFSDASYNMDIDAEFSHIFFFLDTKTGVYKKKNYIYILNNGKVKLNGLPILKSNAPKLAKKIYIDFLEKEIKRTKNIEFDRDYIKQLIDFEIKKNIEILKAEIRVNYASGYASESQMQCQISKHYFNGKAGMFQGIKHLRKGLGVGKGKFYCSLEEAHKLKSHEFDLETVWKTLDPFIKKDVQEVLFEGKVKKKKKVVKKKVVDDGKQITFDTFK